MNKADRQSGNSSRLKFSVTVLAVIGVTAFALLLRAPLAGIPFERDEGEYAYMAQRWLAGDIPYVNTFDQKPPGVFAIYALIERLVGTNPQAVHWATQAYTLLTLAVIGLIGARLFSPFAAFLSALLASIMTLDATVLGQASNTEIFLLLPATLTLLFLLVMIETPRSKTAFLIGLFLALGTLMKQVAMVYASPILLVLFLLPRKRVWLSMLGLGFLTGLVPCLYWIRYAAWHVFLDCVIGYNLSYARLGRFWPSVTTVLWPHIRSFWPVYAAALISLRHCRSKASEHQFSAGPTAAWEILWGWAVFSVCGILIGGFLRMHYLLQIIPAVSLLAGGEIAEWRLSRNRRWQAPLMTLLVAGLISYPMAMNLWYYSPGSTDLKSRRLYGNNPFPESQEVGNYLRTHSRADDRIFIFGSEPQILYFAERVSASRYIFMYPAMLPTSTAQARQLEVIRNVTTPPLPAYIVTLFTSYSFLPRPQSPTLMFDEFRTWVPAHYDVVGLVPWTNANTASLITGQAVQKEWTANSCWYPPNGKYFMAIWKWRG